MTMPQVQPAAIATPRSKGRLQRITPETWVSIGIFVVFVGGWEAIVRILQVSPLVIPAPSAIAGALIDSLSTPSFYWHAGVTLWEILAGFFIGAGLGLVLGVLIGQWRLLEKTVYPYVVAFQTVPKVAVAPLIVIWFGYGITSKIVITAMIAFFPVVVNCIAGMGAASQQQIDMLRSFTATRWQIFRMIKLQSALPYIFAGLDVAIILAVIGAIVGEFIGAQAGLGYLLLQRNFSMDTAGTFAILIVLSLIGMVLHQLMKFCRRKIVFWANDDQRLATDQA